MKPPPGSRKLHVHQPPPPPPTALCNLPAPPDLHIADFTPTQGYGLSTNLCATPAHLTHGPWTVIWNPFGIPFGCRWFATFSDPAGAISTWEIRTTGGPGACTPTQIWRLEYITPSGPPYFDDIANTWTSDPGGDPTGRIWTPDNPCTTTPPPAIST